MSHLTDADRRELEDRAESRLRMLFAEYLDVVIPPDVPDVFRRAFDKPSVSEAD